MSDLDHPSYIFALLDFFVLKVMTHVVDALGPDKGPDLDSIALAMVDAATKVDSDEAVSVL